MPNRGMPYARPRSTPFPPDLRSLLLSACSVLFGISMHMWLEEHNEHHAYTLRPHGDPQFTYFPMWLQTPAEIPEWEKAVQKMPNSTLRWFVWNATKALVRVQHLTFLPLALVVGRVNFLMINFAYAVHHAKWADIVAMTLHGLWYSAYIKCLLPESFQARALFVLVHFTWTGVLHVQLLLSHLMMQQFNEREEAALGFVKCQLLTTRNIHSAKWLRWFHGGLDMQIEHHLFPMLPRHQLHDIAPRVRALAEKHGVPYIQLGFFEANWVCLSELHKMSTSLVAMSM